MTCAVMKQEERQFWIDDVKIYIVIRMEGYFLIITFFVYVKLYSSLVISPVILVSFYLLMLYEKRDNSLNSILVNLKTVVSSRYYLGVLAYLGNF